MASFIRMPFMLVFHQSKFVSAVNKRILFNYLDVVILVFMKCICVFLVIAMYA